jgi:hypothetical protein
MFPHTSRAGFSASLLQGRYFDPVAIVTIVIGIVVMTALTMMF